ncbi:MAG: succinyldiaminopimelate transaminase [Porticoccaceae bacterium]|nr:succinyldiaminopimelate transaminase [Porticoccaceae bacterium]RPG84085.1 MAG: succinyldiaminopimelate transaminase [Cellvibrionales bacterium TMED47]
MNPYFKDLQPYPFEKLKDLKAGVTPNIDLDPIMLSVGEPKHPAPDFVKQTLCNAIDGLGNYPSTKGISELREVIAQWAIKRFNLSNTSLDAESNVLPVAGTREALFAFTQAVINNTVGNKPLVVCPNPCYQIYEGAALLAGADTHYLNCNNEDDFIPNLDAVPETVWQRCQLLQLCAPGNPTGATLSLAYYKRALELADQYDFIVSNDECYSELYRDEKNPPLGLLDVCQQLGREKFDRCIVFHSLSKRSNLPGLRSGFVAGNAQLLDFFFRYRTYHGCALSLPVQQASIAAWSDERHVQENRELYREKFDAVGKILEGILEFNTPPAGFYLWPKTPIDDVTFARDLYAQENLTVLPGSFISRKTEMGDPGKNRIRLALVPDLNDCIEAAERIARFTKKLK